MNSPGKTCGDRRGRRGRVGEEGTYNGVTTERVKTREATKYDAGHTEIELLLLSV